MSPTFLFCYFYLQYHKEKEVNKVLSDDLEKANARITIVEDAYQLEYDERENIANLLLESENKCKKYEQFQLYENKENKNGNIGSLNNEQNNLVIKPSLPTSALVVQSLSQSQAVFGLKSTSTQIVKSRTITHSIDYHIQLRDSLR